MKKKLIELNKKILETGKIKIGFKEIILSKPVIFSLLFLLLEILAVIVANCHSDNQTIIKYCAYSIMIL